MLLIARRQRYKCCLYCTRVRYLEIVDIRKPEVYVIQLLQMSLQTGMLLHVNGPELSKLSELFKPQFIFEVFFYRINHDIWLHVLKQLFNSGARHTLMTTSTSMKISWCLRNSSSSSLLAESSGLSPNFCSRTYRKFLCWRMFLKPMYHLTKLDPSASKLESELLRK